MIRSTTNSAIAKFFQSRRMSLALRWLAASCLFLILWVSVQIAIAFIVPHPVPIDVIRWPWYFVRSHLLYSSVAAVAFGGVMSTRWKYAGIVAAFGFLIIRSTWSFLAYRLMEGRYPGIHAPEWPAYIHSNWPRVLDWTFAALLASLILSAISTYRRLPPATNKP
jgi:hypothetical protein